MHLTPDFTTPGHDSGLKYFIICLLNSDIPFRFSHFFENGAFRVYGTFCGKFLSRDLHQNNSVSLMNESYPNFLCERDFFDQFVRISTSNNKPSHIRRENDKASF